MTSIESTPSVQSECTWVSPLQVVEADERRAGVPASAAWISPLSSRISGGIQGRSSRA